MIKQPHREHYKKNDKTTTQRKKQDRPDEFWIQQNTYHSWNRPPEKILGETFFY